MSRSVLLLALFTLLTKGVESQFGPPVNANTTIYSYVVKCSFENTIGVAISSPGVVIHRRYVMVPSNLFPATINQIEILGANSVVNTVMSASPILSAFYMLKTCTSLANTIYNRNPALVPSLEIGITTAGHLIYYEGDDLKQKATNIRSKDTSECSGTLFCIDGDSTVGACSFHMDAPIPKIYKRLIAVAVNGHIIGFQAISPTCSQQLSFLDEFIYFNQISEYMINIESFISTNNLT